MQYLSSFVWFISLSILSLSPLLWTRFSSLLWLNKLIIQEMQIKIMRYHFIPVRKSVVKKTKDNRCWRSCWCECKLLHPLWKTVWRYLKKLELELPYDLTILFPDTYPKKTKAIIWKDTFIPVFIAASFKIAKIGKQPKYLSVDAMRYYSHSPHQKKSISCHLDNMHGSRGYFANERNQIEKDKYCMIQLIWGI